MRSHESSTYFATQAAALDFAFTSVNDRGYTVDEPQSIWTEHVAYGTTVHYNLPLIVMRTGNPARKWLHIALYRIDSGRYELTFYSS